MNFRYRMVITACCEKCNDEISIGICEHNGCGCGDTWMESKPCTCGKYSNPHPPIPEME